MATQLTQGVLLRKIDYREFDVQCVIYTRDLGKILAVGRGAKKTVSKLNSHLEPFLIMDLMLAHGMNSERVAAARINRHYLNLQTDRLKINAALYLLESVDVLVKFNWPDQEIFYLLDRSLSALAVSQNQKSIILTLNQSLFDLLKHLGYQPVINSISQRQLLASFNNLILEAGERELKSFYSLKKTLIDKSEN